MDSENAIEVQGIGKRYRVGRTQDQTLSPGKRLLRWTASPFDYLRSKVGALREEETLWALRDVSFTVRVGEVIGVIGRNGAGKSTLLKILSRITDPTEGRAFLRGSVSSLLEVGTGFHPELTGRENVFLYGAIHGMPQNEIRSKFDEIVSFAELERFIDTPVKRYSSGMYMRLAFAVAAHLQPDILIVDEVLAVGDVVFQKKCIGKMGDVAREGRTVLFVSHNMAAVVALCSRAVLLDGGRVIAVGPTDRVMSTYMTFGGNDSGEVENTASAEDGLRLRLERLRVVGADGRSPREFRTSQDVYLEIDFRVLQEGDGYAISTQVHNLQHGCLFTTSCFDQDPPSALARHWDAGSYRAKVRLPTEFMRGGEYWATVASAVPTVRFLDKIEKELHFHLLDTTSPVAKSSEGRQGSILPVLKWEISRQAPVNHFMQQVVP